MCIRDSFNTVENVRLASSSLRISISLSALLLRRSGITSSLDKLNAAWRSMPVLLGIYLSLNIDLLLRRLGEVDGNMGASLSLGGSKLRVDLEGDRGVSNTLMVLLLLLPRLGILICCEVFLELLLLRLLLLLILEGNSK